MNNDSNINQAPMVAGLAAAPLVPPAMGQLFTPAPAFSWPMARTLAEWSALAYNQASCSDGKTNASALIGGSSIDNLIVTFKGSSTPMDFLHDAEFGLTDLLKFGDDRLGLDPAKVHTGALADFNAINAQVVTTVKQFLANNPQRKLFITGHSLGGMEAILCAFEFQRQRIPVEAVYTFGQPRVGNSIFAKIYDSTVLYARTFRVVNQNDIVPRVPGVLMKYRHCGQEIFLPSTGGWCMNPALWEKILSDAWGLYGAYRNKQDVLIREHFIAAYESRIATLS